MSDMWIKYLLKIDPKYLLKIDRVYLFINLSLRIHSDELLSDKNYYKKSQYLLKFADDVFHEMGRCTIYTNCIHFVALVYYIKALLEALSWGSILTINSGKTDPWWNLDIFFIKQFNTSLQILFSWSSKWFINKKDIRTFISCITL